MLKLTTLKLGVIFIDDTHPSYSFLKDCGDIQVKELMAPSEQPEKPKAPPAHVYKEDLLPDPAWLEASDEGATSTTFKMLRSHTNHFMQSRATTTIKEEVLGGEKVRIANKNGLILIIKD